jgi:hypothetical protein
LLQVKDMYEVWTPPLWEINRSSVRYACCFTHSDRYHEWNILWLQTVANTMMKMESNGWWIPERAYAKSMDFLLGCKTLQRTKPEWNSKQSPRVAPTIARKVHGLL